MYKLFSFKKHSGTTGQPLPRRAISYQEFSVIHVSKLKGTLDWYIWYNPLGPGWLANRLWHWASTSPWVVGKSNIPWSTVSLYLSSIKCCPYVEPQTATQIPSMLQPFLNKENPSSVWQPINHWRPWSWCFCPMQLTVSELNISSQWGVGGGSSLKHSKENWVSRPIIITAILLDKFQDWKPDSRNSLNCRGPFLWDGYLTPTPISEKGLLSREEAQDGSMLSDLTAGGFSTGRVHSLELFCVVKATGSTMSIPQQHRD